MTGWVVERQRTALASVPAAAVSALMPPHSQGAEKRVERRRRWAMRALVVGGLAGAAWLLTGAAAQAADHEEAAGGSSLLSSVVRGDAAPVVGNVLKVAAQPLDVVRPQNQQHQRKQDEGVLARPVAILTGNGKTDAHTALGAVDGVVRELTGPLRLTGGPDDSRRLAPVAASHTRILRAVTGTLPQAAAPARTQSPAPAETPVTRAVAPTRTADLVTAPHPKAAGPAGHRHVRATTASAGKRHSIVTEGHPVAATAARPDTLGNTGRRGQPGGDGPAPLQVHLGALSGISTSASGAPTEGGSAAFLPAAVASGLVAYHRLRTATDVEVRRFDAEAPTVSPD